MLLTKEQIEYKKELIALYKIVKAVHAEHKTLKNFYVSYPNFHPTSNEVDWKSLTALMKVMFQEDRLPSELLY
jgi:hypothetical protein